MITRPNCSFQVGVVSDGAASASNRRSQPGTSSEGAVGTNATRSPMPSRPARARSAPSAAPLPTIVSRQSPRSRAAASSSTAAPFSGTSRPRKPIANGAAGSRASGRGG